MKARKRRAQPRLKNGIREPLPSAVQSEIRTAVNNDARRYSCSRSWVAASILAKHYGIKIVRYDD